ncbi:MAG: hypothetical protein U0802_15585 [Candidatus Binatia bacterium]
MRRALPILVACLVAIAPPAGACTGDLDGDGRVTVAEIVGCVDGLLAAAPAAACRAGYPALTIAALVRAVIQARDGCPATPTSTPSPTAVATPTRAATAGTPTPTFTRAPTATLTSCVSDPPYIRGVATDPEQPFRWHVNGWSRILLYGRGSLSASLDCQAAIRVRTSGYSQEYDLDVTLTPRGAHLVSVCTQPAICGTAWCRQRRIDCDASGCTDRGDLPPVLARDLTCPAP